MVLGVGLATAGDYYATGLGFFLTILGALLASLKTVVTNKMLTGRLKLSSLELLYRMSPLACAQTIIYAFFTGELSRLPEYYQTQMTQRDIILLIANGAIAFALNVVSFGANKKTGALTMTVAANIKQILTIVLSIMFWGLKVGFLNASGIILTLIGGAWYAKVELEAKKGAANGGGNGAGEKVKAPEVAPLVGVKTERGD